MNNKSLTLSIVIPVYNEERYLKACLDSIASQSVMPNQVIVVDNNSTDKSMAIAKKYNFVKVLQESKQSQVFAQKTGFDAVGSDLIGRIDADSVLPANWVASVKDSFLNDSNLLALTGGGKPYDVSLKKLGIFVFRLYNILASLIAGRQMIWGANCALRTTAWKRISCKVLQRADVWEDYDLAFLIGAIGKVRFIDGIIIGTSFRAIHKPFLEQARYQFRSIRTFYFRTSILQAVVLMLVWPTMTVFYPIVLFDELIIKKFINPSGDYSPRL